MTDPAPPTTDLKDTLEAMRASVAAQGERTGLAGAIQDAILKFLEMFLAMLVEFRAGRLAALAPVAEDARRGSGSCVARGDRGEENTLTPVGPLCGPTPRCAGEGEELRGRPGARARRSSGRAMVGFAHPTPHPGRTVARRGNSGRGRRSHWPRVVSGRRRNARGMRRAFPRQQPPCRAGPGRIGAEKRGVGRRRCTSISLRYHNDIRRWMARRLAAALPPP